MHAQSSDRNHRASFLILAVICLTLFMTLLPARQEAAAVNGALRQVGTQQVLNLWGSNYDMGYAHGYLLAGKIRDLVDHYMIGTVMGGNVTTYNSLLSKDASQFQWQVHHLDEIRGMADGMKASGKSLYVASLGRSIDSRDIRALNLQEEFYFGCSSFGAWRNATATGETILARNLDFYYDSQGNNANYQMIIAYEPASGPKIISFAWPGAVGIYSGMNQYGVAVMANTGNLPNPYSGPFHPVVEVYRSILETTTTANYVTQPLATIKSFHENPSEIIQVGIPWQGSGYPVYYIEQSPDYDLIRYPADTGYDHIIATNHFMSVTPPPTSGDSLYRYTLIRNGLLALYGSGDRKVDSVEAWRLLHTVANIVAPTLTSIVIRPNSMEFDVAFATYTNGQFTDATALVPQTYTWASLFPGQVLSAANDSYSTTQGTALIQAAPGVLANDTAPEGATLTARLVSSVSHGVLILNSNGSFSYTPAAGYTGGDSFSYQASDGTNSSSTATVTIAVIPGTSLLSLAVNPAGIRGGMTSQGMVTLNGPAPAGGASVALSDNSAYASLPASVTVPAGSSSAAFTITTVPVPATRTVTITASFAGAVRTATLTLKRR